MQQTAPHKKTSINGQFVSRNIFECTFEWGKLDGMGLSCFANVEGD
jgi:hypothetical protein